MGTAGQNIQVFLRARPLNKSEVAAKAYSIVDIPSHKEVVVREKINANHTKNFQFDRVFGPKSQQLDVYKSVVEPLIEEVLMGYNCTVFAYGQTGTGKTFTMEGGEMRSVEGVSWDSDPTSGIVPRAMSQIFDRLRESADKLGTESSVRVSILELYNEEIFDLLSSKTDTTKLRMYEDVSKKGSVIIHGLEDVVVHTKSEVYNILEQGSDKRKTAETLMNAQSSRYHESRHELREKTEDSLTKSEDASKDTEECLNDSSDSGISSVQLVGRGASSVTPTMKVKTPTMKVKRELKKPQIFWQCSEST